MPTQKLTDKTIKNAKAPDSGRVVLWDGVVANEASLPGSFGLRVTANGVKSWIIMYRIEDPKRPGKIMQQYRKIGSYPSLTLGQAREAAREALKLAGQGIDPIEAKASEKQKVADIKTVKEAVDAFVKRHVKKKNRSWKTIERSFALHVVPVLGERPLPSVTPTDIHELLDRLMDSGQPYAANRVLAHVRKFFHWCVERQWISEPPTRNIKSPGEEQARDRVMDNNEIKSLWSACDVVGWPFGPSFKLLMLTGQRRNEVAGMKWADIDFDKNVWSLPKEATKAKRQHDVPLMVAGYPFGDIFSNTIKVTGGMVSAVRGVGDDTGQFQMDAAIQPGNSGGPIYDENGNIVGVVISQLNKLKMAEALGSLPENVNFGIKASTVRQFLTSSGLPFKSSQKIKGLTTQQLAKTAETQTLMVMCYR